MTPFSASWLYASIALFAGCAPPNGEEASAVATSPASPVPMSPAASRCTVDATTGNIACTYQSATVGGRPVLWQTPLSAPPAAGWPVALFYQGSFVAPQLMWSAAKGDVIGGIFGAYTEALLIKRLLDGGFVVVTPQADLNAIAWDTNLVPWRDLWQPAPDNQFLVALFAAIDGGAFGSVDPARWYATGVSSGGYMTSRMAVSYPGRFRALAVSAGSYATCGGPLCAVPLTLPTSHPPTLFLHGGIDPIVPIATMYAYRNLLTLSGRETRVVVDPTFLHGWIPQAPDEVVAWFDSH